MIDSHSRIVIIGGSGFVGKTLIQDLQKNGFQRILSISRNHPIEFLSGIEYADGADITRPVTISPHLKEADVVINLAGKVSFKKKDRNELHAVNVEGVKSLVWLCHRHPNIKRLLHMSSSAAFGFSDEVMHEETVFSWEDQNALPYSKSKALANLDVQNSHIPTNILFPSLILGPGDTNATKKILRYVRGKKRVFSPPGKNSIIDVRDVSQAILAVLKNAPGNQNYILASENVTFSDLFLAAASALRQDTKVHKIPQYFEKPSALVSAALESIGIPVPTENIILGFKQRNHSTNKLQQIGFIPKYSLLDSLSDFNQ